MNVIKSQYPPSPPPNLIPSYNSTFEEDIETTLKNKLYTYVYFWTKEHRDFWMYPTMLTPDNVLYGFQWVNKSWVYASVNCKSIDSFY